MSQLDKTDRKLYDFLLSKQTFQSKENEWLRLLTDIAAEGKHTRLTPQKRTEIRRTKVSGPFGHVSWDPNSVKFGAGVQIMGAPIDPRTQHIIPTQNVTEEIETWVSFIFED